MAITSPGGLGEAIKEKDPLGGLLVRGWGWLEGLGEEEGPRLYTWYPRVLSLGCARSGGQWGEGRASKATLSLTCRTLNAFGNKGRNTLEIWDLTPKQCH